jgi:hypothetical protein
MNRLKSIIVLRIYVYAGRYSRPKEGRERERGRGERELFDLSECVWHHFSARTVVVAVKRKKENTISKSLSTGSLRFSFSTPPVGYLLSVHFNSTTVFVRCSSVQHFSKPCHSIFSLSVIY